MKVSTAVTACCLILLAPGAWSTDAIDGVHCQIDQTTFDGDADVTRIDYVIPPGDKPPRFRLLAGHANDAIGLIAVELKFHGVLAGGAIELSLEPTWKSVVRLPKQQDSVISKGSFVFSHFEPSGDQYAAGTVQFQTADAHKGQCRFRLPMQVLNMGH